MPYSLIFIGGPRDGEVQVVDCSVVNYGKIEVPMATLTGEIASPVSFTRHQYTVHAFLEPDGETRIYMAVSEDIDPGHVMQHILSRYVAS